MSLPITKRDNAAANMPAGGARPAPAGGVQVIQRFDGEDLQKNNGVLGTGLGAQRDRTHQLVQHQDASGKWQVHVQSLNEGRVNPSQYVFTSNRPVTARDFNNPDSMLSQKAREATDRLNADSNRLPDTAATPTNKPAAKAQATPADRSTWSQKVDYAGYKAIVNNVFKPVGGLLKAVGLPQLDSRVKHATADLDKQAASLGMNTQDNVVKVTDLGVSVVLAYGGGAIGKAGKLAKLPQMAQTTIGVGVMSAVQRIGSDVSDGQLNRGTVKRAGIDIAQGVVIGKLGGKGMVRQIAAGTSLQVGRQALEGQTITPGSVVKTALLRAAGSAGWHAGGARPKIQPASSARPAATAQQSKSAMAEMKNAVNAYDGLGATASRATRAEAAKRVVAAQQDINSLRDQHRDNDTWSAKDKQQYLSVMKAYGPRADQIGGASQRGQSAEASSSSARAGIERFERRPGESMFDYLARRYVPQSLTPQQQLAADLSGMRMSATPRPSGRIDRAAARDKVQALDAQETTLLRGLHQGEQGADMARAQGWSTQQFLALRDSALHKMGANDIRAAIKVAEAGGLLSTKAALPAEVVQATAQYDQSAWRETILHEPPFAGVHLPPAQKQLFFAWIDNKLDVQGTAAALGKPVASTRTMLNRLAYSFGFSVDEMKTAVRDVVPMQRAEAPANWPEAARQRFALLGDNAKVQRAQLTPRDVQLLSFWTHSAFDRGAAASVLGLTTESMGVRLSRLSQTLGFETGAAGQRSFKQFLTETTAPMGGSAPQPEAPATWPEAARQRFALLSDDPNVQRAHLTPRDIELLSFWTHSTFDRGAAATVLGLTADSLSVRLSRLSQALGFETGATGQRAFKQFLTETTAPNRDSAPQADASSLIPPGDARYGNLNLSIGGLAQSMPGLNVNPLRSDMNCVGAAVALDRQRGGAPASALAADMTNAADLGTLYGRLPEQGFSAKVNGRHLLPPETRFDMASLQRYVGSLPDGARGILLVNYRMLENGHALVVENVKGHAMFIDGQSGLVLDPKAISSGAMVLPALAGSSKAAGRSLAELPDIHYMFLRTDDVSRLDALPQGTRQGIVVAAEAGNQRVRVADPTGVRSDEWVDVSNSPGLLSRLRLGENVYVVEDANAGTTSRTRVVPQSAGLAH